jgi:hypothetical protein
MQKFRVPEIFLGALMTVAIFAIGMTLNASRPQPANNPTNATIAQVQSDHKPEPFTLEWLTHDGVAFFTAILCFVAFVQAGLFFWQLLVLHRTLKETSETTRAALDAAEAAKTSAQAVINAERAYLWPGFAGQLGGMMKGGGYAWNISILNTGHTAGILNEIYHALVSEDDFKAGRFSYTVVPNRGEIIPPARPQEESPSGVIVKVPTETLISCGYIVYTDVYRVRHEQAWKHRLHATGASEALVGCYSDPPDKSR